MERKLSPVQVLERLQARLQRRVDALEGVKLDGYTIAIAELQIALDLLRRARRYLEQ
jgi:cob(I)alamin adenosyltransferase